MWVIKGDHNERGAVFWNKKVSGWMCGLENATHFRSRDVPLPMADIEVHQVRWRSFAAEKGNAADPDTEDKAMMRWIIRSTDKPFRYWQHRTDGPGKWTTTIQHATTFAEGVRGHYAMPPDSQFVRYADDGLPADMTRLATSDADRHALLRDIANLIPQHEQLDSSDAMTTAASIYKLFQLAGVLPAPPAREPGLYWVRHQVDDERVTVAEWHGDFWKVDGGRSHEWGWLAISEKLEPPE